MSRNAVTLDGNEAVALVAYKTNEVIAIYPITPSSTMGEWADAWAAAGKTNIWGDVPAIQEMQSEGGVAGAVHGALQTGALTTTFTASQGLLLMIPNMYKIAGELNPCVIHVAARCLATHALSIFGDHSDVMSARSTGFAMLASASVQEAMDMALIAHASTLEARVPFMHFFDGFRTSHEVLKVNELSDDDIRFMIDDAKVAEHRARALSPDRPVLRGTAQNPDVFFQAREACNPFYNACPGIVQKAMDKFAGRVGRRYKLFDYFGAPDAERVVVLMGSGVETVRETAEHLVAKGEKVGVVAVRLYRPFASEAFVAAMPKTVKTVAVLDRTKEPGAGGEPLYLDAVNALVEAGPDAGLALPKVIGGRYGLSSKEFTPAMVKGLFDEMKKAKPKNHFTIGINDDVTHTSIPEDPSFSVEPADRVRAVFFGLGADGTVGANKNSIKIIGENTDQYAQGYFVYDSKKSGSVTVSHLRFGPGEIHAPYLVSSANFIGCHQFFLLERYDVLATAAEGAVFLLNSPYGPEEVWDKLPRLHQERIIQKKLRFYVIDGYKVARDTGMGGRINTIMQTCFFKISGILPEDQAIAQIKDAIKKTYGKRGEEVVKKNYEAVDQTIANLFEVKVYSSVSSSIGMTPPVTPDAPDFVRNVLGRIVSGDGDKLPVSAFTRDGTFPTATAKFEKRNIALEIPVWDPDTCIQCGKCAAVCPHAVIRIKVMEPSATEKAPATFKTTKAKDREWAGLLYNIQVSPEDCTGCGVCVDVCPAKNKSETRLKALNMEPQPPMREEENKNWAYFLSLPEVDRSKVRRDTIRSSQLLEPLFEFSGACGGCGETPYLKMVSQLFGDRMVVANATGCSSIYGGNLPTTPWAVNGQGRGPAWSNSLFEDNAEFGLGYRISLDKQMSAAVGLLKELESDLGSDEVKAIIECSQKDESEIEAQRVRVAALKKKLPSINKPAARRLAALADGLVKRSVWIVGGDGWAYDIGFGGLDHVLASGLNVNVLVLDTEVYSNTGGQMSKSTPRGAVAKFAAAGKPLPKKDLGLIAMSYGNVYVARIALGARDDQTLKALLEAEAYSGPSLIIAYSHCIAHGIDMKTGLQEQKAAVASGHWPLFRFNPELDKTGKNPFQLDSKDPSVSLRDYVYRETRYKMLTKSHPQEAEALLNLAQADVKERWAYYKYLSERPAAPPQGAAPANGQAAAPKEVA